MNDSNKQICRLCLEIAPSFECVSIEEIRKEILEVLPINLDFNIRDYVVVCNMCLETLQHCFDFKSQCIFADADAKVDIKNILQNEMMNNGNICLQNSQVCQLCMSIIKDKDYIIKLKNGILLKDMVRNCLPDLDLNTVHEPLICNQCLSSITRYYEFMKSCEQVERRIEHFCQVADHGTSGEVNLKDMLKLKDYDELGKPTITEKECLDVENVGGNVMECHKSEEILSIKYEDIDIKDELDNGAEISKSDHSEDYDTSKKFSKGKGKIKESKSKGKQHFCPKCSYSSNCSSNVKKHLRCHSDKKVRRCTLCSFVTDARLSLRAHIVESHSGLIKAFGCRECPYETDQKRYLDRHILMHKSKWEVEMYNCALCPFKSKYKSTVVRHHKMKHVENVELYKCKECPFSTKHKTNVRIHQLVHKSPDEIPKYKCVKCDYKFKTQGAIKKHMLVHSGKRIFRCDKCSYYSTYKGDLYIHKCEHRKDGERNTYECEVKAKKYSHFPHEITAEYLGMQHTSETTEKQNIQDHALVRQKAIPQCDQCDFWIKHKGYPQAHMCFHKNPKQSIFQSDHCKYPTTDKPNLNVYRLTHVGVEEAMLYYCATCNFETKYKCSLRDHVKRCLRKTRDKDRKMCW